MDSVVIGYALVIILAVGFILVDYVAGRKGKESKHKSC